MSEAHAPTERDLPEQIIIKVPGELAKTDKFVIDPQTEERLPVLEYRIPLNPDSPPLKTYREPRERMGLTRPLEMFLRLSISPQEPEMQIVMRYPWASYAIPFAEIGVDSTPPTGVSINFQGEPTERITLTVPQHSVAPQLTPLQDFLKEAALSH